MDKLLFFKCNKIFIIPVLYVEGLDSRKMESRLQFSMWLHEIYSDSTAYVFNNVEHSVTSKAVCP